MRNIDFNKYQSALIIGNGFDLSLGLSTSYMDFVNSDEFQILLNMQNQLAISYSVFFFFKNIHSQVLIILLNYFLSCTYIVFPLFLFFLLFVRICNIAETYITS